MKSQTKDLTQGNVFSQVFWFSLPLLVGQLFQTLYNSVDSIVVGNFVGTNALAAVTASATIAMFISGFFNGMGAGASVLFSRLFGAKKDNELNIAIHTTLLFSAILGAILAGLGIIFTPQLLELVTCPSDVYDQAELYLRIYLIGILFTSMYNIAAGVLRSVGDSKSPFYYLVISSCLNIVLDIAFVAFLNWGVAGVAIATLLAQFVSVALSIRKISMLPESFRFSLNRLTLNVRVLKEVLNLGLPAGLQTSLIALSAIFIQRYINSFSAAAIAGIGAGMKIDQFSGMPCQALGLGLSTFIGQNIGAGKFNRTHKGVLMATLAVVVEVVVLSIPIYIFASQLTGIFGSDPEMIEYGVGFLHTIMPVYLAMGISQLFSGVVRGYGYSKVSMAATILGYVVIRQIWLAVTLTISHDITYVYLCYPVGWFVTTGILVGFYLFVIRRKFR